MTVLASGSKGNSTVIASARTRVLVDAGLSCRELLRRMALAGEDPAQLDAILITHEHQDHVAGLAVLARRLRIPVFFTEPTHRAWVRMLTPRTTMTYAAWLDQYHRGKLPATASINSTDPGAPRLASETWDRTTTSTGELKSPQNNPVRHLRDRSTVAKVGPATASAEELESLVSLSAEAASFDPQLRSDDPAAAHELPVDPDEDCDPASPAKDKADPTFLPAVEYFQAGHKFAIGDLEICPFTIPHDAADPCGFVFESQSDGIRMALATDLGYMPPNVKSALKNVDVLLLESNHDLEMLKDGPYPWSVKQRVLSRVGHLSNEAIAEFLQKDYDGGAAWIVLGHLSESNNLPELARITAERALGDRLPLLGNRVLLALQSAPLDPILL